MLYEPKFYKCGVCDAILEAITPHCCDDLTCCGKPMELLKANELIALEEKQFANFSAIAGASPAFHYMYIDAIARAAVKEGMPKAVALQIAADAVLGSAKMILESQHHPIDLVDQVCSPGGTTIEGVIALKANGFEHAVHEAVHAVVQKDHQLK